MINYRSTVTQMVLTEKEVNEHLCMLIIFCEMNKGSEQATKLCKHLKKAEKAINKGKFKN